MFPVYRFAQLLREIGLLNRAVQVRLIKLADGRA
jgi:hypothetical protein